jgi:hypothetical protein
MLFHCSSVLALECAHLGVVDPTVETEIMCVGPLYFAGTEGTTDFR